MQAQYHFDVDVARDLLTVRLGGMFDAEDLTTFMRDRRAAHARLACGPNMHVSLVDARELKIQLQTSVYFFRSMLDDKQYAARRLAFVVSPSLARNQIARAAAGRDARFFSDPVDAEYWLTTGEERQVA